MEQTIYPGSLLLFHLTYLQAFLQNPVLQNHLLLTATLDSFLYEQQHFIELVLHAPLLFPIFDTSPRYIISILVQIYYKYNKIIKHYYISKEITVLSLFFK